MPLGPRRLILILWLAWVGYWVAAAFAAKRTQRRESPASRLSYSLPLLLGAWLIAMPQLRLGWLSQPLLPQTRARAELAVLLVAAGLAFAVWARAHLGRNWSGSVTLKESHALIRSGPYACVRHPIYTGLLLALVGTALPAAEPAGLIGLALVVYSFLRKLRIEERFLGELFGAAYVRYRAAVPALVPFTGARRSAPR